MPDVRHGIIESVDYDLSRLRALGRKRQRLLDQIEALRREMLPEIRAARDAGVSQQDIADASRYRRDRIRQMCLPPDKAEAEAEKRRSRTRKTRAVKPTDPT